jgi:hypothetical protein
MLLVEPSNVRRAAVRTNADTVEEKSSPSDEGGSCGTRRRCPRIVRYLADGISRWRATAGGLRLEITFTAEHRVEGQGGANRFGGPFTLVEDELDFGPMFSTRMAGSKPANRHEARLLSALAGRRAFAVETNTLVIGSGADEVRLRRLAEGT